MTANEIKKAIVESFNKKLGFSPCIKDIKFLETTGFKNKYTWVAFHINGKGYCYREYCEVERATPYDVK